MLHKEGASSVLAHVSLDKVRALNQQLVINDDVLQPVHMRAGVHPMHIVVSRQYHMLSVSIHLHINTIELM